MLSICFWQGAGQSRQMLGKRASREDLRRSNRRVFRSLTQSDEVQLRRKRGSQLRCGRPQKVAESDPARGNLITCFLQTSSAGSHYGRLSTTLPPPPHVVLRQHSPNLIASS